MENGLEKIVNEKIEKNNEKQGKYFGRGIVSAGIVCSCLLAGNHPEIMHYVYGIAGVGAALYSLSQSLGYFGSLIKDYYLNSMLKEEGNENGKKRT